MKIKIIIVYFGEFPSLFPLWLKSCEYNSQIDFVIITDNKKKYDYPKNVQTFFSTLEDVKNRFEEVLHFQINLKCPYKLCDFRVLYGRAFSDLLVGYDFWGHCDLDMIFGDLSLFLTDEILQTYDKIYQYGHLTLYRNNSSINNLYMDSSLAGWHSYKRVFCSSIDFAFDECGMRKIMQFHREISYYDEMKGADIFPCRNYISLSLHSDKMRNYSEQIFCWREGHIIQIYWENETYKEKEYAYIHLFKRDMKYDFKYVPDLYYITKNSFVMGRNSVTEKGLVAKINPYPGDFGFKTERIRFIIKYEFLRRVKRKVALAWENRTLAKEL